MDGTIDMLIEQKAGFAEVYHLLGQDFHQSVLAEVQWAKELQRV